MAISFENTKQNNYNQIYDEELRMIMIIDTRHETDHFISIEKQIYNYMV